jgi:predicted metal-dependent HD superfamily phosphohydrolase
MDVRGMDELELRVAWQQHVAIDMHEFEAVLARHREPHRRYHGERHVRWVVRHAQHLASSTAVTQRSRRIDLGAVIAAAFYHDAVYDPKASGNEAASARLASEVLVRCGWEAQRVTAVAEMIEATASHSQANAGEDGDLSTAVLLAADLAVLAADPPGYNAYVEGVRFEYAHVGESDWVSGRSAVLRGFIQRTHIFPAVLELREWEARARANIAAELAALNASS